MLDLIIFTVIAHCTRDLRNSQWNREGKCFVVIYTILFVACINILLFISMHYDNGYVCTVNGFVTNLSDMNNIELKAALKFWK